MSRHTREGNDEAAVMCLDAQAKYVTSDQARQQDPSLADPRSECTDAGGELFEAWNQTSGQVVRYGCRFSGPLNNASCTVQYGGTNTSLEFLTCEHYGDPGQPYNGNEKRCKGYTRSAQGWWEEQLPAELSGHELAAMQELGCSWERHAPCRSDEQICNLGEDRPNADLFTVDCDAAQLDTRSAECTRSGACSDDELRRFGYDDNAGTGQYGCVRPMEQTQWGGHQCPQGWQHSKSGCMKSARDGAEKDDCLAIPGGKWVTKATTEAECDTSNVCYERNGHMVSHRAPVSDGSNPFTENGEGEYCQACISGHHDREYKAREAAPLYTWSGAQYNGNSMNVPLEWKAFEWTPLNAVVSMIDHTKFRNLVMKVITRRLGREEASALYANWLPRAALLATISCDCVDANTSAVASTACFSLYNLTNVLLTALTPQRTAEGTLLSGSDLSMAIQGLGNILVPGGLLAMDVASLVVYIETLARTALAVDLRQRCIDNPEQCIAGDPNYSEEGSGSGSGSGGSRRLSEEEELRLATTTGDARKQLRRALALPEEELALPGADAEALIGGDEAAAPPRARRALARRAMVSAPHGLHDNRRKLSSITAVSVELVQDACENIIGQIVGDGVSVEANGALGGTVQLCLTPRGDIPRDTVSFPTSDVCTAAGDGSLSVPLQAAVDLTSTPGSFCIQATPGTTYVPVIRYASFISHFPTCGFPATPPLMPPAPTAAPVLLPTSSPTTGTPTTVSAPTTPTAGAPTTATPSPTMGYVVLSDAEATALGSVSVAFNLAGDLSDYSEAFQEDLREQVAADCGIAAEYVTLTLSAGSVLVTLVIQATSQTSAASINVIATANFGSASAMASYIEAATGQQVVVTGFTLTYEAAASDSKKSSGIIFGLGIAVVAGAAGGIAVVLLAVIVGIVFMTKRKGKQVSPGGGPDGYGTGTSTTKVTKVKPAKDSVEAFSADN
jgi:hypothetical protein